MPDTLSPPAIESFLGQIVVLDTQGPLIYIGTLQSVSPHFWTLHDADVHDRHDSRSTKEFYLTETRQLGVRINRTHVHVAASQIASFSRLEDIVG